MGISENVDLDIEVDANFCTNVCGLESALKIDSIPSNTKIIVLLPYSMLKILSCTRKSAILIVLTERRKL
jgi:hypothetical protein